MMKTIRMQSKLAETKASRVGILTWPRAGGKRRLGDTIFRNFTLLFVLITLALVVGVAWILVSYSLPTITAFGFSFLTNQAFDPVHNVFGVAPAIFGTLVTSFFAIIFAVPIGIGAAIFLVEFCPQALRSILAFVMELLVAIPSVVIGLWGFLVLATWLGSSGEPWLQSHLGFLPFFRGQPHGLGLLAAGIVLVIMILPLIISVSREVMLTVPQAQREALLALGATRWEVIRHVVLPASRVGIMGGIILALGRALGETMAVTMVIGNQATKPSLSLFDTGYTLSSVIANQFGEATQGLFLSALLEAGLLVFLITLATNVLARWLVARMGRTSIGGLNT
jgi:phosphate transport system permease protein